MTDDRTPYQRLDDAIHEFASSIDSLGGTVSGWALGYELSAVIDEPGVLPLIHRAGYTAGPGTSPATALGLHTAVAELHRQRMASDLASEDEDTE